MGKQGPCYHCGVTSTPLWRNGPPEKPVLCNACGSRWRTKGTLAKYTPLHARAEVGDHEDRKASSIRSMSLNKTKETKTLKRKPIPGNVIVKRAASDFTQGLKKVVDEDTSNRSSSGSAISNSESCAQLGSTDGSDFTDPAQSSGWETIVPSKKRTCVGRPKPSPVEKLTKDLYMILQEQQSSCFSSSFEEDLIFENDTPTVSVEIGHGSVLMRHPHLSVREEESEASSLSVENKIAVNVSCSNRMKLVADNVVKDPTLSGHRAGKAKNFSEQGTQQERLKMNKSKNEKLQILGSHSSPLRSLDLGDIINFEVFSVQFTTEEQEQLMKFVPSQDTYNLPDSLRSMFDSPQLKENFSFFQHLLVEGVFDSTLSGTKDEDCSMLKKHALLDTTKSHLTECYSQLMKRENDYRGSSPRGTDSNALKNLSAVARACGNQKKKFSETRDLMMSPKRIVKPSFGTNKPKLENEALCISSKGLFAVPQEGCSVMSGYEISDNDLLLDVPSYGSFPLAELLHQL